MRHTYSKHLRAIRTTFINVTSSLVLLGSSMSAALPLFFTQTAHAASNNVVTAGHSLGWAFTTTGDATSQYTTDPSVQVSGSGSYELRSDSGKKGYLYDSSYASRDLTSLKHLSYSYYVANRNAGTSVAPALSLITTINGTWTELKVEPTYTNGAPAGSWQTIDAFAPTTKWYSTHDLKDVHNNTIVHKFNGVADLVSWDTLVGLDHSAKLGTDDGANGVRFTIGQNSGGAPWSNFDAYIDNVNINDNVYDFEPTVAPSVDAENFNTNSDSNYKGINVGFNISNFKTVSKVSVSLYKDNTLLVTNTQNQNLLDLISGGATELSTPFIIQDGTYHEDYWNLGVHNWKSGDKPTKALISVTGTDGDGNTVTKTAENDNFVEPNGWTFDSLLPPSVPGAPNSLYFTQDSKTLSCSGITNSSSVPTLHWTTPSGNINQYAIVLSYPDSGGGVQYLPGSATAWWVTGNFANHGQGVYSYTVKAENTAGQWSPVATCGLMYDSVQPVIDIETPTANSYVRGIVTVRAQITENGSGIKNVDAKFTDGTGHGSTPNEFGTVTLHLVAGTTDVYEGQIDTTGHTGVYSVAVDAWDNANNSRSAKTQNVTIDNTAPTTPAVTGFTNPTLACGDATNAHVGGIAIHWTPSNALSGIYQYAITPTYPDNHGEYTYYPSGSATSTWIGDNFGRHGDGVYSYTIKAQSKSGLWTGPSTICSLIYDSHAPTVGVISPTAGEVIGGLGNNYKVTVQLKIDDATGVDTNPTYTWVEFYNGSAVNGSVSDHSQKYELHQVGTSDIYTADIDTTDFVSALHNSGTYSLAVRAKDTLGNASSHDFYYRQASDKLLVDNNRPTASITTPANHTFQQGTFTITGTASDPETGIDHVSVYVAHNPWSQGGYVVDNQRAKWDVSNGTFTYDVSNLPEGSYTVKAFAYDQNGNVQSVSSTITVDNTAPAVPTSLSWLGSNGDSATNGFTNVQKGTLSWQDSTPNDVDHYVYKFWTNISGYHDGYANAWTTDDSNYFNGASIWTNFDNHEGTYYFCVEAVDAAGNTSACSDTYVVTYDSTPPAVSITSATQNSKDSVSFDGFVNDTHFNYYYCWLTEKGSSSEIANTRGANCVTTWAKDLQKNGNPATSTNEGDGSQLSPAQLGDFDITGLTSGEYTVHLIAVDLAGNKSTEATQDVTVDHTAPTLTIDAYNGTDTTPTITGTTTDATDVVTVDGNSATVSSTVNGSGTYDWSYTPTTAFSLGTTTVTVVSTDLLGNAFQKTADITVTATANPGVVPTVTVTPHADGHVLGDSTTTPNLALATNNTKSNDKSNGNVQGDQTSNSNNSKDKTITSSNDFLGLGWWWLLILAVILGFFWFLLGKRTDTDDKEA